MLFTQTLPKAGKLTDLPFTLMQVGSRKIYEEDFFPRWPVLAPNFTVYGFEADPTACAEANQATAPLSQVGRGAGGEGSALNGCGHR
ncbi:MAG: hypothetical protein ACUVSQ_08780 [Pseudanabaenaceae cyanobacterium]